MTDAHQEAMELSTAARLLALDGRVEAARERLERAAEHEEQAAETADETRPRTRGILRVSAVSLWLQAGHPGRAASLASRYLGEPLDAAFARELDELRAECEAAERVAALLPVVPADFVERAREQEDAFSRHEFVSGTIAAPRRAA